MREMQSKIKLALIFENLLPNWFLRNSWFLGHCLVGNFGVRERLFFVLLQAFVTLKKNWQTSSTEFTMKNYSDLSYFLMKTAKYIPNYKLMLPSFQKDIVLKHQWLILLNWRIMPEKRYFDISKHWITNTILKYKNHELFTEFW